MSEIRVTHIEDHLAEAIEALRTQLEGDLDDLKTAKVRGRLQQCRILQEFIRTYGRREESPLPVDYIQ